MDGRVRIGVDATNFVPGRGCGAQTYLEGVLSGMEGQFDVETVVFCSTEGRAHLQARCPALTFIALPVPQSVWQRWLWNWHTMHENFRRQSVDVAFYPFNIAGRAPVPSVLMVHDLISHFYRSHFPRERALYHAARAWAVERSLNRATHVICPSQAIADEITRGIKGLRAPVTVIPESVADLPATEPGRVPWDSQAPRSRILISSFRAPHKTPSCVLQALAILGRDKPDILSTLEVWFTGPDDAFFAGIRREAEARGVAQAIHVSGYVSFTDVMAMYRSADLVVCQTLYEGFGLPVIEAVAAGTALLLSDIPVLREVSGGDATFYDPRSPADLAAKLEAQLRNPASQRNLRHRSHPVPVVRRSITWHEYAKELVNLCLRLVP
jgi:glycosyltransferase involved in cell wall biosynthesis